MRLLDLFCGAGGAAEGYRRAGVVDIVGIDSQPMPRYPFQFVQGDALEYLAAHGGEFDIIHASPVCKGFTPLQAIHGREYPDYIAPLRELLVVTGKPYIIENVPGAPLKGTLLLCGTMFGLGVIRHRIFETFPQILFPPCSCQHRHKTGKRGEYDMGSGGYITVAGHNFHVATGREAMGIDWMSGAELSQAIPPAYTQYIGARMLEMLRQVA